MPDGIRFRSALVAVAVVSVLLAACSDGVTDPTIAVSVSPSNASLLPGESRQFTATVTGTAATGITWTASAGVVSGNGNTVTYTAPATQGTHSLTATSVADPTRSASASITVDAGGILVNRAPIPSSGGTIAVDRPGSPLHGMRVILGDGAYPTTSQWTITEEPDIRPVLPAGIVQATTAFRIGNEHGFADDPFIIGIPVDLAEGEVPTAFMQDPVTGALELVPPLGLDEDGRHLWVMTRHVSRAHMAPPRPSGLASFASAPAGTVALNTAFGDEIRFFLVKTAELSGPFGIVHTSFVPGVDDWEFPNYGSQLSPRGFCAGSTITAMYYHYFQKAAGGPLFNRFKRFDEPDFWIDNPLGIRLASVVQENLSWKGYADHRWQNSLLPAATANEYSRSFLQVVNLATAMRVTGLPQQLAVHNDDMTSGHALIAYGMRDGTVLVADPNAPGESREIRWGGSHWVYGEDWEPFSFAEVVNGPEDVYTKVWPVGVSTLINTEKLHGFWADFQAGTIGDAEFPSGKFEYLDPELDQVWRIAGDTVRTANDSLVFRWVCVGCGTYWETPSGVERQTTSLFGPGPQVVYLGEDWYHEDRDGAPLLPEMGKQEVWVAHVAKRDAHDSNWNFVNFFPMAVHRFPFSVTADKETPAVNEAVTFTVDSEGLEEIVLRFRWDFGDGTVTETLGAYDAEHAYETGGTYVARVELRQADGEVIAKDSVKVAVQLDAWVGTATVARTNNSPNFAQTTRAEATNVRFEMAPGTGSAAARFSVVSGQLTVWNEVPCAGYVSPVVHVELTNNSDFQWLLIRETDPAAPEGTESGPGLWYRGNGYTAGMQIYNKVCPTDFNPNPEAYVFSTGVVWLTTFEQSMWTHSANRDVIQGTLVRHGTDDSTTVWTWRFVRVGHDEGISR